MAVRMFAAFWAGWDQFSEEVLGSIDVSAAEDDLERSITQSLTIYVRRQLTGNEPFDVIHGAFEHESRLPAPAQPPAYDFAFVLLRNQRMMWPVEAKVVKTDESIRHYLLDVNEQFLRCRYAPFSGEGAMLAYLLEGSETKVFARIEQALKCELSPHEEFRARHHRVSQHDRIVPAGKEYLPRLTCHHIVVSLRSDQSGLRDAQ